MIQIPIGKLPRSSSGDSYHMRRARSAAVGFMIRRWYQLE